MSKVNDYTVVQMVAMAILSLIRNDSVFSTKAIIKWINDKYQDKINLNIKVGTVSSLLGWFYLRAEHDDKTIERDFLNRSFKGGSNRAYGYLAVKEEFDNFNFVTLADYIIEWQKIAKDIKTTTIKKKRSSKTVHPKKPKESINMQQVFAKRQLQRIAKDINARMRQYTHSAQPTDDEVTIAWLLTFIDENINFSNKS